MKGQYKNGKPFDRRAYMKVYNKKMYALDRENQKERARMYVANNPEKVQRARKNWYLKNGIEYRNKQYKDLRDFSSAARPTMTRMIPSGVIGFTSVVSSLNS